MSTASARPLVPPTDVPLPQDSAAKLCLCASHSVSGPLYMVGFYLCAILRRSPTPIGTAARQQMTLIQNSIAAVPLTGARGDVFPLLTTLSAEDEVLVTAAEKGDKTALEANASREAGHRVWLHCIILVLNALAFSPQSFDEDRAAAAFSGIRAPSNHHRSMEPRGHASQLLPP